MSDEKDHHVAMDRINEMRTRFDLGDKTLTFEDGMAVAYAMAERMHSELDQCVEGSGDPDDADYWQAVDDLADLTSFAAWVHGGYRLVVENVTQVDVPPEARAGGES